MKRNVLLLSVCQALMMTSMSLMITTSALVGFALAENKVLATLPLAFQFLGMMSATFPASLLMKRIGRKAGFFVGLALGILGAALSALGIYLNQYWFFVVGLFFIGNFSAFGQYYRFAAADVATEEFKSRAIAYVLAGGVVAAFIGPNLAKFSKDMIVGVEFAGAYIAVIVVFMLSMLVLSFITIPRPDAEERAAGGRTLSAIARQPAFVVAVFSALTGYGVMNIIMTATPLAMRDFGFDFGSTATVIQWHVVGMFAPSFFTGSLIKRFGVLNIIAAGAILLLICIGVGLSGTEFWRLLLALILLGLGWNFMFLGGTTLVTETYAPNEKARTQGLNDLLVFGTTAMTALLSGVLHHTFGWTVTNLIVVPFLVIALILAVRLNLQRNRAEAASAAA